MALYYKQPKYYDKFRCIGGKCTVSCCEKWRIDWYGYEIKKVKDANPSEKLASLLATSFRDTDADIVAPVPVTDDNGKYSIILKENGNCPFHNEEGLCMIQKELGEEYLSETCTVYPRKHFVHTDNLIRCCFNSCPAVLDLLFNDANAVRLENQNTERDFHYKISTNGDTIENIEKHPVLKYRMNLMEFYNKLITDRNISLESAIVFGALASRKFTDAVEAGKVDEIPSIIKEYEGKMKDRATMAAIEEIKPNLAIQFKFVNNLLITFCDQKGVSINISNLHNGESVVPEKYQKGRENLYNAFKGREYFLRNLAANILLNFNIPFYINGYSIIDNYVYYALTVASLKVIGISVGKREVDIEEKFKNAVSVLSRLFIHSTKEAENIIKNLRESGFTSAAHVALLIK